VLVADREVAGETRLFDLPGLDFRSRLLAELRSDRDQRRVIGGAMPTIEELRNRSDQLFTQLLRAQTVERPRRTRRGVTAMAAPASAFSWFKREDAIASTALAFRLAARAASQPEVTAGLSSALDHVEEEMGRVHPEQVRQGFALFVTHNHDGRRLAKPRTVAAAPELFSPPPAGGGRARSVSIGGRSPRLDYWREDPLANEHHQHWHEVYPYAGLPPRRFEDWLAERSADELVAILDAIQPDPTWPQFVASATPAQLAGIFQQIVDEQLAGGLPPDLYRKLFRLNDRQGELFFYMHQQMLARYDAELVSNGLSRVEPFGPTAWEQPIEAGHNPIEVQGYGRREPKQTLPAEATSELGALWHEIEAALADKKLSADAGGKVEIDRVNLGEAVEATVAQLRALDPDAYAGLHNLGHGFIAALSIDRPGVMASTVTAIRDQVFWQWHKFIDDINAAWQETLDPYDFADGPPVLVRNDLAGGDQPWASPDIILCRTIDLPAGTDLQQLGKQLFGGTQWSHDFTAADASANGTNLRTVTELVTVMEPVNFGGHPSVHLTHEPFSYFLRLENTSSETVSVTVRTFLAPAALAADRRAWMEMDKFLLQLPANEQVVAYRPDTESSIVKRPSETSPAAVTAGGGDPDEQSYCDCGWPYALLLPRGTEEGMAFRLAVVCTDAQIDQVMKAEHCGSMSYCGAVDRYPDTRDMGYPFCRPLAVAAATAIEQTIVRLPQAAGRTVTIRHAP
jgi:hypothetical protein